MEGGEEEEDSLLENFPVLFVAPNFSISRRQQVERDMHLGRDYKFQSLKENAIICNISHSVVNLSPYLLVND